MHSAAELASGTICTCLPTIPALLSQRRTSRGDETMQRDPHSRHLRSLTRKQPTSSSDQDPFDGMYLELSEGCSQDGAAEELPAAVVTDIEGGKPRGIQTSESVNSEGREDGLMQGLAIMKTVVVE